MAAFLPSLDPVQFSLLLIVAAAVVLYVGVRLLWAAVPSVGLWRGAAVAGPVVALALVEAATSPAGAVAMLVGAGVLAMTLGLGVACLDLPEVEGQPTGAASPVLRSLLPVAATVCLAGFHGELTVKIAAAIAVVGGLSLWTASGERRREAVPAALWSFGVPAVLVLAGGLALLTWGTAHFRSAAGNAALTPVVVLLTVPAALLAMIGLLAAEARRHSPQTPLETVTGFTLACLGIGLPLAIVAGRVLPKAVALAGPFASTQPSTQPTTQPALPVVMPLATWRIDSVLLLVVAALLIPVGTGRLRLGKVEGALLIFLYLAYAAVATRTGAIAG